MYEIFEKLLNEHGVRTSDVVKATGLSSTFFSEWKKGKSKSPKPENLQKIADYFGVTVDYLVTGKEKEIPDPLLADDFTALIELYNSSNKDGQARIMEYAKMIAKEYKK